MKSVFIAGSRKFFDKMEDLVKGCKKNKINVKTAGFWDSSLKDTLKNEKKALLSAFKKIDNSEVVYIFAIEGYVGKTVAMEIAYSYSKNKKIISSEKIKELSCQALISKVMKPDELIKYCK